MNDKEWVVLSIEVLVCKSPSETITSIYVYSITDNLVGINVLVYYLTSKATLSPGSYHFYVIPGFYGTLLT